MKFKVKKVSRICETNINGKVVSRTEYYLIYRRVFFGLFCMYLDFYPYYMTMPTGKRLFDDDKVYVCYKIKCGAYRFQTEEAAKDVIAEMESNPDKFIRCING